MKGLLKRVIVIYNENIGGISMNENDVEEKCQKCITEIIRKINDNAKRTSPQSDQQMVKMVEDVIGRNI